MSDQISVTPELIQNEINRLGANAADLEFHARAIHTVTAKPAPIPPSKDFFNTNPGSVFEKPSIVDSNTTSDIDIFGQMQSETVKNIEKAFDDLRIDFAQETIDNLWVLLLNMQTAKDAWVEADETLASQIGGSKE